MKYEIIKEHASKYKTKNEFRNNDTLAYDAARKRGILNDFFDNVRKYWEVDEAINELKKYKSKTDVYKNNRSLYNYSVKNKLFDCIDYLYTDKDDKKRCVYVYVDEINKVAYVGLTLNKEERHETHKTGQRHGYECKSSVFEYFKSINQEVPYPIYLEENLSGVESQKMEDNGVEACKLGNGGGHKVAKFSRKANNNALLCFTRRVFH